MPGWLRTRGARRRLARRVTGFLLIAVSGYLGGVAATSLLPTRVETANYLADLRLTPWPSLSSTVHSPTLFGAIDLDFSGPLPAPGVDATVQVKKSITTLIAERNVSVAALQPSDAEVSAAIGEGSRALAAKFAAGTLVVAGIGLGLLAYGRRRRLTWHHWVLAGSSAALVLVATGTAAALTYRVGNLQEVRTTGVLSTVRENANLLGEVEARARQATPYVRNLLALSQSLQEKFSAESLTEPVAARVLLVSDIHGANQYPLMAQIVSQERIDAVVDSGDLINFGSVAEAEAAGIFSAIESLNVPYVFVRGNHDASSATDQALLQRMARIPNVILLQPGPGRYVEVSVRGVRFAGFNDPRWFGDSNRGNSAAQAPAADAFRAAFEGRDVDVVVSHEPAAVAAVPDARVRIHGHMHVRSLDGNTIGVGTFTGGGPFTHFVESEAGDGELAGQPYAFDIAAFGQACTLATLTRYTYRDLVSGQPAYNDVSVISGRTIESDPPTDRTCSAGDGISAVPITVTSAESRTGSAASPTTTPTG